MAMAQSEFPISRRFLPRPAVLVPGLLMAVVVIAGYSSFEGTSSSAHLESAEILQERILNVDGNIAGAAEITDENGVLIADYASGEAVFITTIGRVIERQRIQKGVPLDGPIHLRKRAPNRLSVYDPATEAEIRLSGFGQDNIAAFAALLSADADM